MPPRSESPEIIGVSPVLGKRTRASASKAAVKFEIIDDDNDLDYSPSHDIDDYNDLNDPADLDGLYDDDMLVDVEEEEEQEPEQGEVLWSEDQEKYPHCPAYHEDVKKFADRITEIFDEIVQHLTVISDKSDGMKRLTRQASDIRTFPQPKTPVIALMGDAGAGKSSLISAVLDTPHITKEGNFGKSCTCVITEYRKDFPEQIKKFAAKIEFLTNEQRSELLREHLKQYFNFHFESDEDWSFEEERDFCAEAKTAESTFSDLFRGRPSFNSHDEIDNFMRAVHKDNTLDATVATFEKWCDELTSEHTLCAQTEMIQADSAFQLTKVLGPFLSSSASWNDKPSLWPVVHKVSIGIKGPRLLENAIIADLPGVTDINRVRAGTGKNYLLSSDYLWIVAPIGRSATDTGVDSLLYEYGNRFEGRVAIVCTKIDDPMSFVSFALEYQMDARPVKQIQLLSKRAKEQFSEAKASLRRAMAVATRRQRSREVERCRIRYHTLLHRRLEMMVQVRNQKVTNLIYTEEADRLKKGDIDLVYCVSNKHYMWLKGYREAGQEHAPQLTALMTGIPSLRKYGLTIPAQEIWSTYMAHVKHTSNAFVKALRIWATRTTKDNSGGLSILRAKSAETVRVTMKVYQDALRADVMELLAQPMQGAQEEMILKAESFLEEVREWHFQTIRAYIRRFGTYTSSVVGHVSWNTKMMLPAARFMNTGWDEMISCEKQALTIAEKTLLRALDTILAEVKEPMELLKIPISHFEGFLGAQKHGIRHAFSNYIVELDKELKNVKHLVEKDDSIGYFAKAMKPIYELAQDVRGKGSKARVLLLVQEHVSMVDADSPFVKMAKSTAKAVNRKVKTCLAELETACLKIFDEIFLQFGCLVDEIPDVDGVVAGTKLALRDYLVTIDDEMGAMIKRLEEIEKDPRPAIVEEIPDTQLAEAFTTPTSRTAALSIDDSPTPGKRIKMEIKVEPGVEEEDED